MLKVRHCIVDYLHKKGYRIDRPQGLDVYTVLLFKQPLTVWYKGEAILTEGCTALIYDRDMPHLYYSDEGDYLHDCVHFSGDEFPWLVSSLGLPMGRPIPVTGVQALSFIFRDIRGCFTQESPHAEETLDLYLRILLYRIADSRKPENSATGPYYEQLVQIRQRLYAYPAEQFSVESQCERLHISVSRFQHLYRQYFGTTYVHDRIGGRLEMARQLLAQTDDPVSSIAEQCGYENAEHFLRQFKKGNGVSPRQYRQEYRRLKETEKEQRHVVRSSPFCCL
jgi:AraC family transcriptional regulator of arabinose operon